MSGIALGAAAIGAGATIYSGKQAAKAGRPSKQQRLIEDQIGKNLTESSPIGMDFLRSGRNSLKIYDDFYKKLARGDRNSAMQLLAPQFATSDRARANSRLSQLSLSPRSGGAADSNLESMDATNMNRENSILGLRTDAVDKMGALGGDMASIGNSILGQGSSSGLGLLGAISNRNQMGFDAARAQGQGLWDMLKFGAGQYQSWRNSRPVTTPLPAATNNFGNVMQFSPGVKK